MHYLSLAFILPLAAAAQAANAQQPAPAPMEPAGAWTMDYADHSCDLRRDFGTGDAAVRITLSQSLAPMQVDVKVEGAGVLSLSRANRAVIDVASGQIESIRLRQYPGDPAPLVFGNFRSLTALEDLGGASVLRVRRGDRQMGAYRLTDLGAALTALRTCQDDLYRSSGIEAAAMRRIAVDAEPVGNEDEWVTPDDLPPAYQNMAQTRLAIMRFDINTSGRVESCRILLSTGAAPLDAQSCRVMQARARYRPARDGAGQAVATVRTKHIDWWRRIPPP